MMKSLTSNFDLDGEDTRGPRLIESNSSEDDVTAVPLRSSASLADQLMEMDDEDDAEEGGGGGGDGGTFDAMFGLEAGGDPMDGIDDEDDEDLHGYARGVREEEEGGGSEAEEADEMDIDVLCELPEDLEEYKEGNKGDAWATLVAPRLKAIYKYVHMHSQPRTASEYGGKFIIFFAHEPSVLDDEGAENLAVVINCCRMTSRPRFHAIAQAWVSSRTRKNPDTGFVRPGHVVGEDIKLLVQSYTTRASSRTKVIESEGSRIKYSALVRVTHGILKQLGIVHALATSVQKSGQIQLYQYGYSKKYPILNLLAASVLSGSPNTLVATLREMRRQATGHYVDQHDELEYLLEDMLEPTM